MKLYPLCVIGRNSCFMYFPALAPHIGVSFGIVVIVGIIKRSRNLEVYSLGCWRCYFLIFFSRPRSITARIVAFGLIKLVQTSKICVDIMRGGSGINARKVAAIEKLV